MEPIKPYSGYLFFVFSQDTDLPEDMGLLGMKEAFSAYKTPAPSGFR